MSMAYVQTLSQELRAVGIRGRQSRRITAEIADHLALDPDADLGSPRALAQQFADELGTVRARRAAAAAFGTLALAATVVGAAFLASLAAGVRWPGLHPRSQALTDVATVAVVIGGQVAFVAGLLAEVRVLRFRDRLVIPRAEARIVVRRTAVALAAGLVTMAGVALAAVELRDGIPSWITSVVLAAAAAGAVALIAVAPAALGAARVRPVAGGQSGDLFDDLGPLVPKPLRGRPWTLAVLVAIGVAIAIAAAGVLQSDPYDGMLRGIADALACLTGFALLGRYLGLQA
jgi:hypothetical protein